MRNKTISKTFFTRPGLWSLIFVIMALHISQLAFVLSEWQKPLTLTTLCLFLTLTALLLKDRQSLTTGTKHSTPISLQDALQYSPVAYHTVSPTGFITSCNDLFAHLVQAKSKSECIGKSIKLFIPANKHQLFDQRLHFLSSKREHQTVHYATGTLLLKSGESASVSHYIIPEYCLDGTLSQLHVLLLDLKEQVDSRILSNHFETFFGNLPAVTFIHDTRGVLTHANKEALSLLNASGENVINKNFHDILPKEISQKYDFAAALVSKTLQSKRSTHTLFLDREQKNHVYDMTMVPLVNEEKTVTAIATIAFDITYQKEMEEQLFHKTQQFRLALQDQGVFYWTYHANSQMFCFDSEYFATQIGNEDLLQQNFTLDEYLSFTHPEDRELVRETFGDFVSRNKEFFSIEYRLITRKNEIIWIRDIGDPIEHNAQGQMTKLIGITINITKLKIAQQHLEKAKQAALQGSMAKSDFLSQMSHEIRTPLNAIVGLSHLLGQEELPAKGQLYTDKLKIASGLLLGIVNDILDHAKIEAGKLALTPRSFSLSRLLRDAIEATIIQDTKKIDTSITISSTSFDRFVGDSQRISQILVNLLSNAFKFTPDGGRITISVDIENAEGSTKKKLLFTIKDTGIGFSKEVQNTLFTTFTQADTSITDQYGGTGLGLAISKKLAELMGGEIGCESIPEKGSCFWFTLYLAQGIDCIEVAPTVSTPLVGKKILLVEDNALNQFMTCELLEQEGVEVSIAHNGQKAIEIISKGNTVFDLVLMDIQMPIMDGCTATEHIRKTHPQESLPILATSANNSTDERKRCLAAGMNDFVPKPISPSFLFTQIAKWIQKSS